LEDLIARVTEAVVNGSKAETLKWVKAAVDQGIDPVAIIEKGLTNGIQKVGDKFECGEYYLPDMMLSAEAMGNSVEMLEPLMKGGASSLRKLGKVVLGTVEGDLHEIGKNIVAMMLKASGFEVVDLGVNVTSGDFAKAVGEHKADILGISALMTTTQTKQADIVSQLERDGIRKGVRVLVGGAPITAEWARKIGADGYAPDAISAVKMAKEMLGVS
jgi:5-methyltetrahydrofolate--homocysteine methyltransferase